MKRINKMINKLWAYCKRILYNIVLLIGVIIFGPYLSFIFTLYYLDDNAKKCEEYINKFVADRYVYTIMSIGVVVSIIPLTIFFYLGGLYIYIREEIVYRLILNKSYWVD